MKAVLALALGVLAAPAAAQRPLELSLLVAPGGSYSEVEGFELDSTAYGLGAGWWVSERWSLELRGLANDDENRFADFEQETFELGVRRALAGGSGWRPFLQAGARYRSSEAEYQVVCVASVQFPCPPLQSNEDDFGPFVGGGVDWLIHRTTALRFDGRLFAYDSEVTGGIETDAGVTVGLVFRF
jgi:hypothetical protein